MKTGRDHQCFFSKKNKSLYFFKKNKVLFFLFFFSKKNKSLFSWSFSFFLYKSTNSFFFSVTFFSSLLSFYLSVYMFVDVTCMLATNSSTCIYRTYHVCHVHRTSTGGHWSPECEPFHSRSPGSCLSRRYGVLVTLPFLGVDGKGGVRDL